VSPDAGSGAGTARPGWLRAGTVGRAHGLDGTFHVGRVVEHVFATLELGSEVRVGSELRRVTRLAGHRARPLMRLEGCERREDAEALNGAELMAARAGVPELEDDEWWAEDLEGCTVRDGDHAVGVVSALLALPSCEVLEVDRATAAGEDARPPLLVPLIRDAVRSVDVERREIDVDLRFLGEEPGS
jgi:16S rRNA processing protein RimM